MTRTPKTRTTAAKDVVRSLSDKYVYLLYVNSRRANIAARHSDGIRLRLRNGRFVTAVLYIFFLSAVKLASGEFRRGGRAMEFGGGGEGEEGRRTDDDAWEERTDGGRRILFISESPTLGIPAGR